MKIFNKFLSSSSNLKEILTNKLYPGGSEGRCSFNGRVMTVFGANGNLGTNVVAELGKRGTQLVIPHRCTYHDATFLKLAGDLGQVHLIDFDPYDYKSILKCLEYSDTVVSCLGNQSYPFAAKRSNIDAPTLIAKAVSQSPHIKNFVHVSCMSQNQKNADVISQTKRVGEKIVRQICPDAVVVRPSTMVGRPDHFAVYVMLRTNQFFKVLVKHHNHVVKIPTCMKDVGRSIAKIALEGRFHGKTFELYSDEEFYMLDIYKYIHNFANKIYPGPVTSIFYWPLRLIFGVSNHSLTNFALVPPHFLVDDIPSKDNRILTFKDLDIEPTCAEEAIRESIKFCKIYPQRIPNYKHTVDYEQPHLKLISKKARDIYEAS